MPREQGSIATPPGAVARMPRRARLWLGSGPKDALRSQAFGVAPLRHKGDSWGSFVKAKSAK